MNVLTNEQRIILYNFLCHYCLVVRNLFPGPARIPFAPGLAFIRAGPEDIPCSNRLKMLRIVWNLRFQIFSF